MGSMGYTLIIRISELTGVLKCMLDQSSQVQQTPDPELEALNPNPSDAAPHSGKPVIHFPSSDNL